MVFLRQRVLVPVAGQELEQIERWELSQQLRIEVGLESRRDDAERIRLVHHSEIGYAEEGIPHLGSISGASGRRRACEDRAAWARADRASRPRTGPRSRWTG